MTAVANGRHVPVTTALSPHDRKAKPGLTAQWAEGSSAVAPVSVNGTFITQTTPVGA